MDLEAAPDVTRLTGAVHRPRHSVLEMQGVFHRELLTVLYAAEAAAAAQRQSDKMRWAALREQRVAPGTRQAFQARVLYMHRVVRVVHAIRRQTVQTVQQTAGMVVVERTATFRGD